ncbi:hypothetical protein KAR91_00295 [Candidatus Pacearchaeota archaeon]|nr:hypothetical protein [Candidatus Pacearchaeota archaeon]
MNTIFVLASDYNQYATFLSTQKDISKFNYKNVDCLSRINGIANGHIIVVGEFLSRGDWKEILAYCERAGWEIEFAG